MFLKAKKILLFITLSLILFLVLNNPKIVISSVNYSLNVFIKNIVPSLFPFFILADFLINYNYIYFLSKILKFKYSYIILMSMVSGLPSNAKYISNLLDKGEISIKDANILLSFTFFPNPMFVIGTVGSLMLDSTKLGLMLLLNLYITNFILYLYYYKKLEKVNVRFNTNKLNFSNLLKKSILDNTSTLFVILGTIVVSVLISNILFNYLNVNPLSEGVITSIFEMTSGIKKISTLNLGTNIKFIIISSSLIFSGISILIQAFSILSEYKLDVKFIIKNKLILLVLNFFISYFYIKFWM